MAEKRIMLLGAGGQIGQALRAGTPPPDWQLGAYDHAACDIADHGKVQRAIDGFRPDLVINAAAMTAVDQCEKDHDGAAAANFDAPANLAAQCSARDIPLIHLSTDYVFDGKNARPYRPDDEMNPVNVYGHTKMLGEEAVRHTHAWHVILRISSVFGAYGSNLLTKALQAIDRRDEIKTVTDQTMAPTPAQDVAGTLVTIADAILKGKSNGFGTFHFCGAPGVTRFAFMQAIMDAYAPHTARRPAILPALSSDFPGFAPRPHYSVLDCAKILEIYGVKQRPWHDGLIEAMRVLMRDRGAAA